MKFEEYSRTFLHFHEEEIPSLLLKHLPTETDFSLADLGAGDGVFLVSLQRAGLLKRASSVLAVDLAEERCERLRQCSDIEVICSDVTDIPQVKNDRFDFVISTQVIEHVEEQKFLREIDRVMRPGGTLYIASLISSLGRDSRFMLKYGWRYGWRFYRRVPGRWFVDPTHLREYDSEEQFVGVIREAGFQILEVKLTPLKRSIVDFLLRRVIVPICNPKDVNGVFLRHPWLNWIRQRFQLRAPGYFIVEAIVKKPSGHEVRATPRAGAAGRPLSANFSA